MFLRPATRLRPTVAATAAAIVLVMAASAALAAPIAIDSPAQPLAEAIKALAKAAGLTIAADSALLSGKTAPAVKGSMEPQEALRRLLAGSGLVGTVDDRGSVVLKPAPPPAAESDKSLPAVTVTESAEVPGALPKPYAGGQVAKGARIGVLGNRDIFEVPISVVAFTDKTVQDQQARTVAEVLRNDTSVKITQNTNSGGTDDVYNLRGFLSASSAATYDGLPRLIGRSQAIEGIERIELLKGPTAFVVGSALFSPGGLINFVPKRATDDPITRLTTRYYSDSVLGLHADIGRRFGEENEFGIRVNGALRSGDTPIEDVSKRNEVLDIALDYRADTVRAYLNADYSKAATRNFLGGTSIAAGVEVPVAPKNTNKWSPTWGFDYAQTKKRLTGRVEWDFAQDWTVSLAHGRLDQKDGDFVTCDSQIVSSAGAINYTSCYRGGTQSDIATTDASVRGRFTTGSVKHRVTLGSTLTKIESGGPFNTFIPNNGQSGSNLYNPPKFSVPTNVPASVPYGVSNSDVARSHYLADELGMFNEQLLITLGLRRTDYEFGPIPGAKTEKGATTPFLGGLVKLRPGLSVYGNYAEALEQGSTAPNNGTVDNPGQILPPQTSKQREIGIKYDAGTFGLTVAFFDIERENALTINRVFGYFGQQRNRGLELNVFGEPVKGLRVLSGLTYLKSKQINTGVAGTEGREAIGVPNYQVQLGGELDIFHWVPGLTFTAGVAHHDKQFVDATNSRTIPAWTRLDVGARYATRIAGKTTTWRLSIENLTDKNYWGSVDRGFLYVGQPRTVSLSATVDF